MGKALHRASIMAFRFTLLSLVLCAAGVDGQSSQDAGAKAAEFTRELEKLKREKPAEYEQTRTLFTLMTKLLLARLGYDVGPLHGTLDVKTEASLRRYQRNRRIPVTGNPLSFETVEQVQADHSMLDNRPIGLPPKHVFIDLWDRGYVSASGTWTIAGEDLASPEQTSRIECHRETGRCTESTASVDHASSGRLLSLHVETYDIERWDQHELITKPRQYGCVRYVRRFNRVQSSVTGIRSTTSSDALCKAVDKSEKHLLLVDGIEIHLKLLREHTAKQKEIVAPDLWKALEGSSK
jgi:Putative peptidoglycan binding domain